MSKAIKKKIHKYPKSWACIQLINCPIDGKEHDWSGKIKTEYYPNGIMKGVTCSKCGRSYSSHLLIIGD